MRRPVLIHGLLLGAALVAAYFVWTREPSGAEDEVPVLSIRGSLDKVVYVGDERTVEIERRKDQDGSYTWLRVETMEAPPPPMPVPPRPGAPGSGPGMRPGMTPGGPGMRPGMTPGGPGMRPGMTPGGPGMTPGGPGMRPGMMPPVPPSLKPEPKSEPKKAVLKAAPKKSGTLDKDPKADPKKDELRKAQFKKAEPRQAEPKKAEPKKAEPKKDAFRSPAGGPPPTSLAPPIPPKPLPKVRKVQQFKGNKSVDELLKGLSNLAAVRSLGKVEPDKLKAFGLAESKKTLTLVSGSSPRVYIIGGNTYGNMDYYLQDKEDGRVYVVRPRLLQDFLYAEFRLLERAMHAFESTEVDRAVIVVGGNRKVLQQQNRRDPGTAFWTEEGSPDKKKDFYRNFLNRVLRLRPMEYVPRDKNPEGLKQLFSVEYYLGNKKQGVLRFFKQQTLIPKVAGSTDAGAGEFYCASEHTHALVKLSRPLGEEVERDVPSLLRE